MKRRLIDLIACPNDHHFPLELKITSTIETHPGPDRCELYCAAIQKYVEEAPISHEDCVGCSRLDVIEGQLICGHCGSSFEIINGIPSMVHETSQVETAEDRVNKDNEIKARDDQAYSYDGLRMLKVMSKLEIPKVVRLLDVSQKDLVVELGAGTGRITSRIASMVSEVVALDFSIKSLKRAQINCPAENIHWLHADINHVPLRNHVADSAFSCQVFEHLPGNTLRNMAVDEAARVIKSAGTFVISVYRDSWVWRLFGEKEGFHPGGIYYYRLNEDEFKSLLTRQFEIKEMIPNLGVYLQIAKCTKSPA